jgi:hypothetical protein
MPDAPVPQLWPLASHRTPSLDSAQLMFFEGVTKNRVSPTATVRVGPTVTPPTPPEEPRFLAAADTTGTKPPIPPGPPPAAKAPSECAEPLPDALVPEVEPDLEHPATNTIAAAAATIKTCDPNKPGRRTHKVTR